jgi:hypothetical protein
MRKQQPTEVTGALQAIKHGGDPIDRQKQFSRGVASALHRHPFVAAESLLFGVTAGNHEIFAYPAFGALGIVGAGMVYGGGLLTERHRLKKANALQDIVRATVQEPVDIIRSGDPKDRQLTMRWYGAEAEGATPRDVVRRLSRLNEAARSYDIPELAIGASWLDDMLEPNTDMEPYGTIVDGESLATDLKQSPAGIHDQLGDVNVLLSTPEQIDALIDHLRSTADVHLLGDLIDRTNDQQLKDVYDQYVQHPEYGIGDVIRQAHVHLSRSLDEHISDEMHMVKDLYGIPQRQRLYRTANVERDRLNILGQSLDTQTGTMVQGHEAADLLHLCGVETLEELIELCEADDERTSGRQQLAAAIYLMAYHRDETKTVHGGARSDTAGVPQETVPTLFERMETEGMPLFPRRFGARPRTIEYGSRSPVKTAIGVLAISTSLIGLGAGVGGGMSLLATSAYDHQKAVCAETFPAYDEIVKNVFSVDTTRESLVKIFDDCDAFYAGTYPIEANAVAVIDAVSQVEADASSHTLTWLYDVLGPETLRQLAGTAADWPEQDWLRQALRDAPPSYYTDMVSQSFTGDVNQTQNQTVYNVTSPKGVSSAGYWYGGVFDKVSLAGGNFHFDSSDAPLNGGTLANPQLGYSYIGAPNDLQIQTLDASAELIVTTPYVHSGTVSLPVHEGMTIAEVVITDENDSTRIVRPQSVARSLTTGLYSMALSDKDTDAMWNAGIRTPMLKYWLTPDTNTDYYSHFRSALKYPQIYAAPKQGEYISNVDTAAMAAARTELAHEAKAALGLAPTATDAQVLDAIRLGKKYSYTPLADNGVKLDLAPHDDTYQQLDDLAKKIEQLDSLNCNLASAAYVLATADSPTEVNEVQGFHDDGDGKLTQLEAHAWLETLRGQRIDPTPTGGTSSAAPSPAEATHETGSLLPPGGVEATLATMGALGAMVVGIRRRRDLLQRTLELRMQLAMRGDHASRAMDVVESALYGNPAQHATRDWATALPFAENGTVSERLRRVVPATGLSADNVQAVHESLANPSLQQGQRRAVKRLLRASKLVHKGGK